jgi:uncharacterized protein (DUF849 family)
MGANRSMTVSACKTATHRRIRSCYEFATHSHPTLDPKYFREFARDIASRSDVVINFPTGGASTMTIEERLQPALRLKPEVASLNMGSMNFGLFPMLKAG